MKSAIGSSCLVAGAAGYIGSHLAAVLREEGHRVVEADARPDRPDQRTWDLDRPETLPPDLDEFDVVYLMAGRSGTSVSFDQAASFVRTNVGGLATLLESLRRMSRPPRVVFPSTRLVYQGAPGRALREEDELEPLTPYGATKIACESLLRMFARQFGVPFTVFRLCVVYGNVLGGAGSYGTMKHFIEPAQAGKPLQLFGDGAQRRSLMHVEDVARRIAAGGLSPACLDRVFNMGGPDVRSIREIAEAIAAVFSVGVEYRPWPADALRMESGDTVFDDARLDEALPYSPRHRFDAWVAALRAGPEGGSTPS